MICSKSNILYVLIERTIPVFIIYMAHIRTISLTETLSQESYSIVSMRHSRVLSNCQIESENSSVIDSETGIKYSGYNYQDLVDIKLTPQHTPNKRSVASEIQNKKSRYGNADSFSCKSCATCLII